MLMYNMMIAYSVPGKIYFSTFHRSHKLNIYSEILYLLQCRVMFVCTVGVTAFVESERARVSQFSIKIISVTVMFPSTGSGYKLLHEIMAAIA